MKVGIKKLESMAGLLGGDPTFIRFESIPACDRRKDRHIVVKSRSSIAVATKLIFGVLDTHPIFGMSGTHCRTHIVAVPHYLNVQEL